MNEKEMNQAILAELKRIANEVFARVEVSKEGTYTAAELWNEKDAFGESIVIDYKGTKSDIYTAEIGSFKMQITPQKLWYVLWKFERLCNVKQADKMRFMYGNQEGENIAEKAMYLGKGNKVTTRKKNLIKLSERVAIEPNKKTKRYNMYYFATGMWYLIATNYDKSMYEAINEQVEKDENFLFGLLQRWDLNTENRLNPIYKALFEVLKSERVNNTSEQRKYENEPEKAVICESEKIDTSAKEFNKNEALKATEKKIREYHPNHIALIRYGLMYYISEESAKQVRQIESVREYIWDTGDIIAFEIEKLDDVLPKLIKAGRGVLTCDIIENEPQQEDYPPEPYNKEKSENVARLATFKIRNVATSYERFQDRTICGRFQKNMRPNYLRQKVFPSKSFCVRSKISRFKPRYLFRHTNYHLTKESALERKRNVNTSVYRALIRGETEIDS